MIMNHLHHSEAPYEIKHYVVLSVYLVSLEHELVMSHVSVNFSLNNVRFIYYLVLAVFIIKAI